MVFKIDKNKCKGCPYQNKCNGDGFKIKPLEPEINGSKILLVFQAPGRDELSGNDGVCAPAPIISNRSHSTAARIRNSLKRINKHRENYDITEVVLCYPGKNKNNRDKKPSKKAIKKCQEHLKNCIIDFKYDKIISFGKIANDSVESIIKENPKIEHIKLAHPSSNKLTNNELDAKLH